MVMRLITSWIFAALVAFLALQRVVELGLSRRNQARILSMGGSEHAPGQLKLMMVLHTAWFLAMLAEVFWLERPFVPAVAGAAALIFVAGQGLRYTAIRTLGWRWTVSVITLPGVRPVTTGIYGYLRHPNYLGVILEVAAVPLLHTAYLTAIFFSIANALLLTWRIRVEEEALREQNRYDEILKDRPRFLPRFKYNRESD
jgi:methyltransferase